MKTEVINAIDKRHVIKRHAGGGDDWCASCLDKWPCDARILLDECRERGRIVSERMADPIIIDLDP